MKTPVLLEAVSKLRRRVCPRLVLPVFPGLGQTELRCAAVLKPALEQQPETCSCKQLAELMVDHDLELANQKATSKSVT